MISIQDLTVAYDDQVVLHGINLEIEAGETVAIMGSSGGGKTTLLRAVAGLIPIKSGDVFFGKPSIRENPEEVRAKMGMVFQSSALFDYMNVEDNIKFGLMRVKPPLSKIEIRETVSDVLDMVGLPGIEQKMPDELSGGMKKRIGLARALALKPESLLYDEPTTGLDPQSTFMIDELIQRVQKERRITGLVVSHDIASVYRTADRIAFLSSGKITFLGTPKSFVESKDPIIADMLDKSTVSYHRS